MPFVKGLLKRKKRAKDNRNESECFDSPHKSISMSFGLRKSRYQGTIQGTKGTAVN